MPAPETTEGVVSWNFATKHVQENLTGNDFISAKSVLIAAGPPRKSDIGSKYDTLYPIGVIDNVSLAQNKGLQTIFEIGSDVRYFLPGRTVNQLNLGRILFYGPSLLRVLYTYYPTSRLPDGSAQDISNEGNKSLEMDPVGDNDRRVPQVQDAPGASGGKGATGEHNKDFWLNLASDVFDKPLGLMMWFKNGADQPYGASYLEQVYLQAHQFTINANNVIVAEGISAQFTKIAPVNMNAAFTTFQAPRN